RDVDAQPDGRARDVDVDVANVGRDVDGEGATGEVPGGGPKTGRRGRSWGRRSGESLHGQTGAVREVEAVVAPARVTDLDAPDVGAGTQALGEVDVKALLGRVVEPPARSPGGGREPHRDRA